MRAVKRIRAIPSRLEGSFETLLSQFSTTTRELTPSLGAAEFARRLTVRAAEMLGARAVALALVKNAEWEIAALSGPAQRWEHLVREKLATALASQASVPMGSHRSGLASAILGQELSEALGWHHVALFRLVRADSELLGVLCIVDLGRELSPTEVQFMESLVGYSSVALENLRLFARVERSRKQWVEDVDAISDFIVVHDQSNRILRLNRVLADLLGVQPTEVIGSEIGELEILGTTSQSGHCPFCKNANATREEFIHTAGDRTFLVSTSRIRGTETEDSRTVHVLKDITDRREAERRYRRERDFNRNILNNTQSMILVLDTAGLVSYANRRCFEAGYQKDELLGKPLVQMVPEARRSILADAVERALQGITIDMLETPMVRGNGGSGQFSISLSPMRDDHGAINSVVVVMTDITDAADLQAKLMHTEKMAALGQLVSGVAHEVNNPLAAIVGFTDLLLENPSIPEESKDELRIILQEAQRTRVIVQNLLSFARNVPAQREPVQANSLLQQVLRLRTYDFTNHGIELVESYQPDLPVLVGDPHQLQQVFLNILNNAYDAVQEARRPGRIAVATMSRGSEIEITFSDNGPGISQPERIFDPFFTTKEVGKGTGLGLSICYGIVRAHHGEITARNNPNGAGCSFVVRLPVATPGFEMTPVKAT